jgi:hypothetical protein
MGIWSRIREFVNKAQEVEHQKESVIVLDKSPKAIDGIKIIADQKFVSSEFQEYVLGENTTWEPVTSMSGYELSELLDVLLGNDPENHVHALNSLDLAEELWPTRLYYIHYGYLPSLRHYKTIGYDEDQNSIKISLYEDLTQERSIFQMSHLIIFREDWLP